MGTSLADSFANGDLDWIKEHLTPASELSQKTLNYLGLLSAKSGHLEVLKWLVLDSGFKIDLMFDDSYILSRTAEAGHLDVVQWIMNHSGQYSYTKEEFENTLRGAVIFGKLPVVRWLVIDSGYEADIYSVFSKTWENSASTKCRQFLLDVAKLQQLLGPGSWREGLDLSSKLQASKNSERLRL